MKAYVKLKKLSEKDNISDKAANVIKVALKMARAKRKRQWHHEFAYYLRIRQHLNLFTNENSIAHSRLLPTD